MPRKITAAKLAALKQQLHQEPHHLDGGQRDALHAQVQHFEQYLAGLPPLDADALRAQFQQWELRMEAEHPVLAAVLRDALQKLSSMGI